MSHQPSDVERRLAQLTMRDNQSAKPLTHEDLARRLAALDGRAPTQAAPLQASQLQQRLQSVDPTKPPVLQHHNPYMTEEDELLAQIHDEVTVSQPWRQHLSSDLPSAAGPDPSWKEIISGPGEPDEDSIQGVLEEAKLAAEIEGTVQKPWKADSPESEKEAGTDDIAAVLAEAQAATERGETYGGSSDEEDEESSDDETY